MKHHSHIHIASYYYTI